MPPRSRELKVGLLVLTAMVIFGGALLVIGDKNNLFSRKNRYSIEFGSVSGLREGNPVQLNGVGVGTVDEVVLPQDPREEQIQVWITVDRRYEERIRAAPPGRQSRGPAAELPQSQARIKTLGLLGDKFVEITSGAPEFPKVPSGGAIPSASPTNVDALISSGEDVMDNVVEISHSLSTILGRMERGEGLLGELTSDSPSGRRLRESMVGTFETVRRIAAKVETGDGPLPRLLNDQRMAAQLASSLDRFESLLAKAESGEGLLPGLLNDPATRATFNDTLATLQRSAQDIQRFTTGLEDSDALLPKLVKDEEYGREVTDQIRALVGRLNTVSERLVSGPGTAAKLINDPQIYDAVNDIIIGVNDSWMLRWLIRNRQKAGIEKRYEAAAGEAQRSAAGAAGDEAQTPGTPDAGSAPPAEPPAPPGDAPAPTTEQTPEPPPGGPDEGS